MDFLFLILISAFAVCGNFQTLKRLFIAYKQKDWSTVGKVIGLYIIAFPIVWLLSLAKFSDENVYFKFYIYFPITGFSQLTFEWFIKAAFIKALIEKVFGVKMPDTKEDTEGKNE